MAATFYIEVDTYWQNSKSYFVGPFASKADAEAWYQTGEWTPRDNVWYSDSQCGGDIRDAWRIYRTPLSKTEARKRGLRSWSMGDSTDTVISPNTKPQAHALDAAVEACRAMY